VFWGWRRIILKRRRAFALETSSAFSKSKGCRDHALGSDWLFTFTYFIISQSKLDFTSSYFVREGKASRTSNERKPSMCGIPWVN
jgi:hypothetical protein